MSRKPENVFEHIAGSDLDDSLGGCLPVPYDELLDLIDERSASESEVRTCAVLRWVQCNAGCTHVI